MMYKTITSNARYYTRITYRLKRSRKLQLLLSKTQYKKIKKQLIAIIKYQSIDECLFVYW